jgi:hypothetical protein
MSISRFTCLTVLLGAWCVGFYGYGQQQNVLKRKISLEIQTARPIDYAASLLRQSGISGGLEDYDASCSDDPEARMPAFAGTLEEGLAYVRQLRPSLRWQASKEGLVVVKGRASSPSILDTKIVRFSFNVNDPPSKVTDALLATPGVSRNIADLGFAVGSPELGFAEAKTSTATTIVTLNNVTARAVLNAIANSPHPRVWQFRQTSCAGRKTLTINWVVK